MAPPDRRPVASDGELRQVLIADDHPLQARGIAAVLSSRADLTVAVCDPLPTRVLACSSDRPIDLVVIGAADWRPWLEMWNTLHARLPGIRAIMLIEFDSAREAAELAQAGVSGVLPRSIGEADLILAVEAVLSGREFVSSALSGLMMDALSQVGRQPVLGSTFGGLSGREIEVLELVAEGLSNRDIGARLHISENTVKNHMRRIHYKLGVTSRTEAVAKGSRVGLLGANAWSSRPRVGR